MTSLNHLLLVTSALSLLSGPLRGADAVIVPGPDISLLDPRYTLRTGDRMQYRIAEDPVKGTMPIGVAVNGVGEASFPVGRDFDLRITFEVRGRTLEQVKEELSKQLLADYYHQATISLTLDDRAIIPGKVQFFGTGGVRGEVQILPDAPPPKLSETLLRMNVPEFANLRRVKVRRVNPTTGQERIIEVNVDDIVKGGQRDKEIILQDGDRVEVPEKWIN